MGGRCLEFFFAFVCFFVFCCGWLGVMYVSIFEKRGLNCSLCELRTKAMEGDESVKMKRFVYFKLCPLIR